MHNMLDAIQLVRLDAESTVMIERSMREKHYRLLPEEPLPPTAYHVFITLCCNRVAVFRRAGTGYGNANVVYDTDKGFYACNRKRLLTDTKRDAKMKVTSRFCSMTKKMQRNIATRVKNAMDRLDCGMRPPVLAVNLKGYRLIYSYGNSRANTRSYQHCPRCGTLHRYLASGWGSHGYACPRCRLRCKLLVDRCAHCTKLIPLPQRRVKSAALRMLTVNLSDVTCPFRIHTYCAEHRPKRKQYQQTPRSGSSAVPMIPPFEESLLAERLANKTSLKGLLGVLTPSQRKTTTRMNLQRERAQRDAEQSRRSNYS
jgi:hypothetical protein